MVRLLDIHISTNDVLAVVKVFEDSGIEGLSDWYQSLDPEFQMDVIAATRLADAKRTNEGRAWIRRLESQKRRKRGRKG